MSRSILKEHVMKIEKCNNKEELYLLLSEVRNILTNNREIYFYNNSIKESVYRLIKNIEKDILCKCGNNCSFLDNNRGYSTFCSDAKCEYLNEKRKKSTRETFERKYGGHPMKTESNRNSF